MSSATLGWLHAYLDTAAVATASLIGAPGIPFTVRSSPIGRDSTVLSCYAEMETHSPVSVYAGYSGTLNGNRKAQTVSGGCAPSGDATSPAVPCAGECKSPRA